MSYRSLKNMIGETSLERKCRFLFGVALLILITASFWLYASRTRVLVENQQVQAARDMVSRIVQMRHLQLIIRQQLTLEDEVGDVPDDAESTEPGVGLPDESRSSPDESTDDTLSEALQQLQQFENAVNASTATTADIAWSLINVTTQDPPNEDAFVALQQFQDDALFGDEYWVIREEPDAPRTLWYYQAVRAEASCIKCHNGSSAATAIASSVPGQLPLIGFAQVTRSLELVDQQLNRNRAVLLATGIVTSFLAMLAAWAIVRYIIVKPVVHLKEVSDEISRGNLNLRAEISTGDEFEELSHAFNRMLRHMMTVNDELRSLNVSLDAKIDELAQANMELFSNNQLKDEFLATISHELRTPLNSILGFSDILQEAPNLDERQKRYVTNIQTSGRSLMLQINDLLDLAKIESGRMEIHRTEVRLDDVINVQVQQVMPLADRKNIEMRIETPAATLPPLFQDAGKLAQILNNLLSNAIKFTPEGGRIRISSSQIDTSNVEFSVADTGIGIPLQDQEQIFEKFRQGSTTPGSRDHVKREYEGTGLGLSIVRELSRLLGGDVVLESEFGKGSLFVVTIPLEAPRQKTSDDIALASRSSTGIGRITAVNLLKVGSDAAPDSPVALRHQSVTAPES
jgi:two-component system, NarL family, sensor histidine kinase BarA